MKKLSTLVFCNLALFVVLVIELCGALHPRPPRKHKKNPFLKFYGNGRIPKELYPTAFIEFKYPFPIHRPPKKPHGPKTIVIHHPPKHIYGPGLSPEFDGFSEHVVQNSPHYLNGKGPADNSVDFFSVTTNSPDDPLADFYKNQFDSLSSFYGQSQSSGFEQVSPSQVTPTVASPLGGSDPSFPIATRPIGPPDLFGPVQSPPVDVFSIPPAQNTLDTLGVNNNNNNNNNGGGSGSTEPSSYLQTTYLASASTNGVGWSKDWKSRSKLAAPLIENIPAGPKNPADSQNSINVPVQPTQKVIRNVVLNQYIWVRREEGTPNVRLTLDPVSRSTYYVDDVLVGRRIHVVSKERLCIQGLPYDGRKASATDCAMTSDPMIKWDFVPIQHGQYWIQQTGTNHCLQPSPIATKPRFVEMQACNLYEKSQLWEIGSVKQKDWTK